MTDGSPPTSEELEITAYASVAILTAFVLDWILCLEDEVEIVNRMGLNVPITAYYVLRLASLSHCILQCLATLGTVPTKSPFERSKFATWWIARSVTSLLFHFRIRAVYNNSKAVRIFFSALWTAVLLTPIVAILLDKHRDCTDFCNTWNPYSLPSNLSTLSHDTLVFLGVSSRIYGNSIVRRTGASRFRSFISGEGLYKVSRSLQQSGQLYYGVTIGVQVACTITIFLGISYSKLMGLAYLVLSSALACRAFRCVLVCKRDTGQVNTVDIDAMFRAASAHGGV